MELHLRQSVADLRFQRRRLLGIKCGEVRGVEPRIGQIDDAGSLIDRGRQRELDGPH